MFFSWNVIPGWKEIIRLIVCPINKSDLIALNWNLYIWFLWLIFSLFLILFSIQWKVILSGRSPLPLISTSKVSWDNTFISPLSDSNVNGSGGLKLTL